MSTTALPHDRERDRLLLAAVKEGDARAMARVIAVHGPAVYGFLRRMLRHDPAVDDLFQDTFLAFARHAADLAEDSSLHRWLLVVAANRWRSYRRWRLVDPTRWLVLDAHDDDGRPSRRAEDAEASLVEREALEELERDLAGLEESDRVVLLLQLDDALTSDDRARALGVGGATYRKRLERARRRLDERRRLRAEHER